MHLFNRMKEKKDREYCRSVCHRHQSCQYRCVHFIFSYLWIIKVLNDHYQKPRVLCNAVKWIHIWNTLSYYTRSVSLISLIITLLFVSVYSLVDWIAGFIFHILSFRFNNLSHMLSQWMAVCKIEMERYNTSIEIKFQQQRFDTMKGWHDLN